MATSASDKALERVISEITNALYMTHDPRFVRLQQFAHGLRSAEQVRVAVCADCHEVVHEEPEGG